MPTEPPAPAFDDLPRQSGVPVLDLGALYDHAEPGPYYRALGALGYRTPDTVRRLAAWALERRRAATGGAAPWVIDIGCGYATLAAGLKYGLDAAGLFARYSDGPAASADAEAVCTADRPFFAAHDAAPVRIAGVDVARNALAYARDVGLLDAAFAEDLTAVAPSPALAAVLGETAVIAESGVPVFVVPDVLDALLAACPADNRPWIVTAPARYADRGPLDAVLVRHGYVAEAAHPEPLPHRRFCSARERRSVLEAQAAMGLDNTAEERTGFIHVEALLARPQAEAGGVIDAGLGTGLV